MYSSVSLSCRNDVKSVGFHVCIAVQGAWFGGSVQIPQWFSWLILFMEDNAILNMCYCTLELIITVVILSQHSRDNSFYKIYLNKSAILD